MGTGKGGVQMRNLLFRISYQGTRYHGYQVQKNALTVAEVLQNAIEAVLGVREDIKGCSRTDTGVHANCYYFNMHTANPIPASRLVRAMNHALPDDIAVQECREVPAAFHARYSCSGKEYLYKIWTAPVKNPFYAGLALHYPYALDIETLNRCCQDFVGTHDFKAFSASGGSVEDTVRTIDTCGIRMESVHSACFAVSGNGFLYHMVRNMVGTLLEINEGKIDTGAVPAIIKSRDRALAGRTVRPDGLYLNRVYYGSECFEQDV